MADFEALWRRVRNYAAAPDPLTATSNRLALILAANQPSYPLYVIWVTGEGDWRLALTLLSTPFFLASPWIAKTFPSVGRWWFPSVGAVNTFFCGFVFGAASGVSFFLAPCLIIAVLSCRATDIRALVLYVCALLFCFTLLRGSYGAPIYAMSAAHQPALSSLNAYCAVTLSAIAIWMFRGARQTPLS